MRIGKKQTSKLAAIVSAFKNKSECMTNTVRGNGFSNGWIKKPTLLALIASPIITLSNASVANATQSENTAKLDGSNDNANDQANLDTGSNGSIFDWFNGQEQPKTYKTLSVIDPYLELRTGAGRGYPITQVLEQGESLQIIARRANWYKVQTRQGLVGWVSAEGLARTLAPSGVPAALPSTDHGDYLKSQARVGFTAGTNQGADNFSVLAGYRLISWAGVEAEVGQSFTETLDGSSRSINILLEPIKGWSFTPFFVAGVGKQELSKKNKLAGSGNTVFSDYSFNGIGINYYIGFNFVVRAEAREVLFSGKEGKERSDEWRIGFSTFF